MSIKFNSGSIAWLCIIWAFYLGMGLPAFALVLPFGLLVIGTILYLFAITARTT